MELWDIYDGNGQITGKTIERGNPLGQEEYHLVVHVWIKNGKGEFLITKRTPNKPLPNMWETTCGSAIAGEDSLKAALREVREEIGVELSPLNGRYLFRLKRPDAQLPYFAEVWLFEQEVDITKVIWQPEEVCGAKWATPNQIQAMTEAGEFADTFPYLEDLFKLGPVGGEGPGYNREKQVASDGIQSPDRPNSSGRASLNFSRRNC